MKDKLEKMTQGNNLRWYILLKVTISVGPFSKFNRVLRLKLNVKLWFPPSPGAWPVHGRTISQMVYREAFRLEQRQCRENQSLFNKNTSSKELNFEKIMFLYTIFRTNYTGTQIAFK